MIYCIGGVHLTEEQIGNGEIEPTIEPMLALLLSRDTGTAICCT